MPLLLLTSLAAASLQSGAPEAWQPKNTYERCEKLIDMRGLVNSQRLECATIDMDRADSTLNAAYRVLVAHVPPQRRQQLIADERAWIQRRHDRCAAPAEKTAPPALERMWCLVKETDKRTAYLLTVR